MRMADASRLDSFAHDVAVALNRASPELQRRVAEFAADWAVAHTGLTHSALVASSAEDVAGLVAELDHHYFAVSEERDAGRSSTEEVVAAFGRARAASAVEFVRRGEPAEAIYEAAASVEDWSELRAELLARLG
jgi:hypothetical protein